jgi:hypothetical protein
MLALHAPHGVIMEFTALVTLLLLLQYLAFGLL